MPFTPKKSSRTSRRRFKTTARSPSRGQRGWAMGASAASAAKAGEAPAIGLVRRFRSAAGQPAVRKQAHIIRLSAAGHRAVVQSKMARSGTSASGDVTGSLGPSKGCACRSLQRTLVPRCLSSATHVPHGPALVHLKVMAILLVASAGRFPDRHGLQSPSSCCRRCQGSGGAVLAEPFAFGRRSPA